MEAMETLETIRLARLFGSMTVLGRYDNLMEAMTVRAPPLRTEIIFLGCFLMHSFHCVSSLPFQQLICKYVCI